MNKLSAVCVLKLPTHLENGKWPVSTEVNRYNLGRLCRIFAVMFWFGLVKFYGISTIVRYSMPNLVYTYISNIYRICKHIL